MGQIVRIRRFARAREAVYPDHVSHGCCDLLPMCPMFDVRCATMCHMSNLYCPNCNHLVGVIGTDAGPDDRLDNVVADWAASRVRWDDRHPTGALFEQYRADTGDTSTSHRRWARAMQRVGYTKGRGTGGARLFYKH